MEMGIGSLLGVTACGGAMIASAQAADLSTKPPATKAPPAAFIPQATNWTGFYVGAHLGGAWRNATWTNPVSGLTHNLKNCGGVARTPVGARPHLSCTLPP